MRVRPNKSVILTTDNHTEEVLAAAVTHQLAHALNRCRYRVSFSPGRQTGSQRIGSGPCPEKNLNLLLQMRRWSGIIEA